MLYEVITGLKIGDGGRAVVVEVVEQDLDDAERAGLEPGEHGHEVGGERAVLLRNNFV